MLTKGSFFIPVEYSTVNISQSVYSFCCWCTTVFLASMNKAAMNMVVYAFERAHVLTKSWGRKVYVLFLGIYRNLTSFQKWRFFQGPCKTPKLWRPNRCEISRSICLVEVCPQVSQPQHRVWGGFLTSLHSPRVLTKEGGAGWSLSWNLLIWNLQEGSDEIHFYCQKIYRQRNSVTRLQGSM